MVINWLRYSKVFYYSPNENKRRRKFNPKAKKKNEKRSQSDCSTKK